MEDITSLAAALQSAAARRSASPSKQHRLAGAVVRGRTTLVRAASHSAKVYGKRALTLIAELLPAKGVPKRSEEFFSWTSSLRRFRRVSRAFRLVADDVLERRVRVKYPRLRRENLRTLRNPADCLREIEHNKWLARRWPALIVLNDTTPWGHNCTGLDLFHQHWIDQPIPDLYRLSPREQIIRACRECQFETDTDVVVRIIAQFESCVNHALRTRRILNALSHLVLSGAPSMYMSSDACRAVLGSDVIGTVLTAMEIHAADPEVLVSGIRFLGYTMSFSDPGHFVESENYWTPAALYIWQDQELRRYFALMRIAAEHRGHDGLPFVTMYSLKDTLELLFEARRISKLAGDSDICLSDAWCPDMSRRFLNSVPATLASSRLLETLVGLWREVDIRANPKLCTLFSLILVCDPDCDYCVQDYSLVRGISDYGYEDVIEAFPPYPDSGMDSGASYARAYGERSARTIPVFAPGHVNYEFQRGLIDAVAPVAADILKLFGTQQPPLESDGSEYAISQCSMVYHIFGVILEQGRDSVLAVGPATIGDHSLAFAAGLTQEPLIIKAGESVL